MFCLVGINSAIAYEPVGTLAELHSCVCLFFLYGRHLFQQPTKLYHSEKKEVKFTKKFVKVKKELKSLRRSVSVQVTSLLFTQGLMLASYISGIN
jgi:hypothetical protein